jgi:hypothetical protein
MSNLAIALWDDGRTEDAERLQEQVLTFRRRDGEDCAGALTAMANLAILKLDSRKIVDATRLEERVLNIITTIPKPDYLPVFEALDNLVSIKRQIGKEQKAEILEKKLSTLRQQVLTGDNSNVLITTTPQIATEHEPVDCSHTVSDTPLSCKRKMKRFCMWCCI